MSTMNYQHFSCQRLTREPTLAERIAQTLHDQVAEARRRARAKREAEKAALLTPRRFGPGPRIGDADIIRLLGGQP